MELTKKHFITLGALLAICLIVTLTVIWDNNQQEKIDTQIDMAQKDLEKQEKEQKKNLKATVGVEIPTREEVARLLAIEEDETAHLDLVIQEYGKKNGEYIFNAYIEDTLPSNKDTSLIQMHKESLAYQQFNEDAYPVDVNLIHTEFHASPPFATTSVGFTPITAELNAGYVSLSTFSVEEAPKDTEEMVVKITVYSSVTQTALDFEERMAKVGIALEGQPLLPLTSYMKELADALNAKDSPYSQDYMKNINYLNVVNVDWSEKKAKDVILYKGTPVVLMMYWNIPTTTSLEHSKKLTLTMGSKTMELFPIKDVVRLPYQP